MWSAKVKLTRNIWLGFDEIRAGREVTIVWGINKVFAVLHRGIKWEIETDWIDSTTLIELAPESDDRDVCISRIYK